jgi:hypothetical protein
MYNNMHLKSALLGGVLVREFKSLAMKRNRCLISNEGLYVIKSGWDCYYIMMVDIIDE